MNFENQVVLITGASSGIGRCLAVDLANRSATVVGCGRSHAALQETLEAMRRTSPKSRVIACDVGDRAQVGAMIGRILNDLGRIDVLINNAGIGMRKAFVDTSLDLIEAITRTNYLGMVYCTHAALPQMISRGSGHIVNISSIAGIIGSFNIAAYSASKFAMNGFSECLYHELKPLGIHVSVVCPGPVRTEFNRAFTDRPPKSPAQLVIAPEAVSRAVIRALERKRFEVVLPRWLAAVCRLKGMAPNFFRLVWQRFSRHYVIGSRIRGTQL